MPKNKLIESSSDLTPLGGLQVLYRVRKSLAMRIILSFATVFILLFGAASFLAAPDIGSIFVCTLPLFLFAFVLLLMLRSMFLTGNDVLRIYGNGFAYQSRDKTQTCHWEEIKDFTKHHKQGLMSVEKTDGEMIFFADDPLPEKQEIIRRFEARLMSSESGDGSEEWKKNWDQYRTELIEYRNEYPSENE